MAAIILIHVLGRHFGWGIAAIVLEHHLFCLHYLQDEMPNNWNS